MMKKTMIIGLGPEYNYPENLNLWIKDNTKYASNHGASFISRALVKQFNGIHVDVEEFSRIDQLREKYDKCIIAFATHVTTLRDVSVYADFIEKLGIPTYAFSLGVQDYLPLTSLAFKLHPSMHRLLEIVSEKSKFLGVRGHYTASILYKNGFKNVIPIGCPTLFWNLHRNIEINKPKNIVNPAMVYHRTLAGEEGMHLLKDIPLIGQDFLDEAVFTSNLENDKDLINYELSNYEIQGKLEQALRLIYKNGVFHHTFQDWFNDLKSRDFILGARLHGCIAGLTQGVPSVMLARDLRVKEVAEFFDIPFILYDKLKQKQTVQQIFEEADYSKFNATYKLRFDNYIKFLQDNGLASNLDTSIINDDYMFSYDDLRTNLSIFHEDVQEIKEELNGLREYKNTLKAADLMFNIFKKIPFSSKLARSFKK